MIFHVHTNLGVFKINAKNPEQARKTVAAENLGVFIGKVKLAGGQRKEKENAKNQS